MARWIDYKPIVLDVLNTVATIGTVLSANEPAPLLQRRVKTPRVEGKQIISTVRTPSIRIAKDGGRFKSCRGDRKQLTASKCMRQAMPGWMGVQPDQSKQCATLYFSMGGLDADQAAPIHFPGTMFTLNPTGSFISFDMYNYTTYCMSVASHVLRTASASRVILCGISLGGHVLHLLVSMMERSAACEPTLIVFDTRTCLPHPGTLIMRSSDTIRNVASGTRLDWPGLANNDKNRCVPYRSKSRLIYCSSAAMADSKPGALSHARRLHESYAVTSFQFEFTLHPDIRHMNPTPWLWDIAWIMRSEKPKNRVI